MDLGRGAASDSDARRFGRFYDSLLTEGSWLRRRVETIHILDDHQLDRRVTLDIDGAELRERADRFGLRGLKRLPVPLETLTKELQLDLDVRNGSGEVLPITLSDEDAHLAHSLLLWKIRSNGVSLRSLTPMVREELFHLVRRPSTDRLYAIAFQVLTGDSSEADALCIALSAADISCWTVLIDNDAITETLIQVARNYVLATSMVPAAEPFIVKFRYVEDAPSSKQFGLGTQFGFRAARFYIPAVGIGSAQREHLRAVMPEGASITKTRLRLDDEDLPSGEYGLRQNSDRSVIYTSDLPKGLYGAVISVRPKLGQFFAPAWLNLTLLAVLMGAGAYLELTSSRFTVNLSNADSAVAIISLLPSATAIYFVRIGEHRLLSRFHLLPRILVLVCAASAISVGAGVAAAVSHEHLLWAFTVAFALNAVGAVYLFAAVTTIWAASLRTPQSTFPKRF